MAISDRYALSPSVLPLRERITIWGGIAMIAALAWLYLFRMPMPDASLSVADGMAMAMPMAHSWTLRDAWLMFAMWAVMMVAMMLPSAAPMLTTYAAIVARPQGGGISCVWLFAAGYVLVWSAFSAVATGLQYALQQSALISGSLRATPIVGSAILLAAGIYQLTPLKRTCLTRCRSPLGFFMTEWREGGWGALAMGTSHGAFCVGCCWMLMALLFVAGVMNLAWVAAISVFVLLEKVAPFGRAIALAAGVAMIISGAALAVVG